MSAGDRKTDVLTEVLAIGKLIDRIVEGQIRIPLFQREFIWKPDQISDLLDSVRQRFPVGSILVWDTHLEMESRGQVGPIEVGPRPQGLASYVLDGQQRLTTLLGTLRLRPDWGEDWKWRVSYDLENRTFFHARKEELQPHYLPVRALLGTSDFLAACRRIESSIPDKKKAQALVDEADRVADVFRNYQLPLIRITHAGIDDAVKIFARLNARGRRITPDEMVSALTYGQGFHLASEITRLLEKFSDYGFGGLDRMVILRAILAADGQDLYDTDWTQLVEKTSERRDRLKDALGAAETAIERALDFLHSEGVTADRLLPYNPQIILLSEFFHNQPEPSEAQLRELQRWFWTTSLTGGFATFNKARAAVLLPEMRRFAEGKLVSLASAVDEPAQPFPARFVARTARVKAFLIFLMSLGPKSLKTGQPLDAGGILAELGPRALRYIISGGMPSTLHSSLANRILLPAGHRGQAWQALQAVAPDKRPEIFSSHGIPVEAGQFLYANQREEFLQARLDYLIEEERKFIAAKGVKLPDSLTPGEPDIDTDLDGEED